MEDNISQKAPAGSFSTKQQLFLRYFTAILIDLVVLNIFDEYWDNVVIESFTISLFVAVVLQILLKATIAFEHYAASHFNTKLQRILSAWAILFVSKIIILEVINLAFGDEVLFLGAFHGLVAFIVVVIVILVAEKAIVKLYQSLA
ncbi:MAG: hypothetical protein DRI65_07570 [Chloroflexota bacterium]|nr:MAG: hypothetical protein DRI65_07570 [Chloroflexota bacterium]